MAFKDKLVFFRTRYAMSKNKLGERMGLSTKIISDWEKGKSLPNQGQYEKLGEIFGIKKDFFIDESLNYKDLENFTREDYWGIELNRSDCEDYIRKSKDAAGTIGMGIYSFFLIPIFIILIDKVLPLVFKDLTAGENLFVYKLVSAIILLILGLLAISLGKKKRKSYKFIDNGMMYYLKRDNRIYMENVIDQEKPKSMQKIIFGLIFLILSLIIGLNFGNIFEKIDQNFRFIPVLIVIFLVGFGINYIAKSGLNIHYLNEILNNQNSYSFEDKNL